MFCVAARNEGYTAKIRTVHFGIDTQLCIQQLCRKWLLFVGHYGPVAASNCFQTITGMELNGEWWRCLNQVATAKSPRLKFLIGVLIHHTDSGGLRSCYNSQQSPPGTFSVTLLAVEVENCTFSGFSWQFCILPGKSVNEAFDLFLLFPNILQMVLTQPTSCLQGLASICNQILRY